MVERATSGDRADDLRYLIRELLLERTEKLDAVALSAFLDGWSGMLDLMRRTDLLLPHADEEVRNAVAELVEQIREAQYAALDDGTG